MNSTTSCELNLLGCTPGRQRWIPQSLRRHNCWKVFSGKWKQELPHRIIYYKDHRESHTENASIIGSPEWTAYSLQVSFRIRSDSIRPPEGGVIVFFLFKNIRNHYAFHFCLVKQKIELIKRVRGVWTTIAERDYPLATQKEYRSTILTGAGLHQCAVGEELQVQASDTDISGGCVGIGAKYCDVEFSDLTLSFPAT